jgi:hypothetical protein
MRIEELRNFVREVIKEAAAEGVFQSRARKSYERMIKTVGTGGNKNTPPFSDKAKSKNVKSAPPSSGE